MPSSALVTIVGSSVLDIEKRPPPPGSQRAHAPGRLHARPVAPTRSEPTACMHPSHASEPPRACIPSHASEPTARMHPAARLRAHRVHASRRTPQAHRVHTSRRTPVSPTRACIPSAFQSPPRAHAGAPSRVTSTRTTSHSTWASPCTRGNASDLRWRRARARARFAGVCAAQAKAPTRSHPLTLSSASPSPAPALSQASSARAAGRVPLRSHR